MVEDIHFLPEFPAICVESAFGLTVVDRSLDLSHDHLLQAQILHPLLEGYHLGVGLPYQQIYKVEHELLI